MLSALSRAMLSALCSIGFVVVLSGCDLDIDNEQVKPDCPDGKCVKPINYRAENAPGEIPAMNIPQSLRMHNYAGGSCVHASTEMCLRWQHLYDWADFWRKTYSGGESLNGLVSKFEKNGLKYAYTSSGDPTFLDKCSETRRGAVIFYFPNHSICFVGHHGGYAYLLDNNREDHFLTVPWDEFVRNWKGYGGFALTPVYAPPPPVAYSN